MENVKRTPKEIVAILHSISSLDIVDDELEVYFDDDKYQSKITGFIPDSFTRQLLELIEDYLLDNAPKE